jgi:hypothetical protein
MTRLTSNQNKWEKPSGSNGKCGLIKKSPYEGEFGFGWEEWLLNDFHNPNLQHEGYCYGFIQAFHKRNKAKRIIQRVYLYTKVCVDKNTFDFYLGYIDNLEVLDATDWRNDLINKKQEFCKKAAIELDDVNITRYQKDLLEMSSENTLFNVRFKPSDVKIKDFDYQSRPIKMKQGQARFGLYDLDDHTNLLAEISKFK